MDKINTYLAQLMQLSVEYAPKFLLAIAVLIIGWWLANRLSALVIRSFKGFAATNPEVVSFFSSLTNAGLKILLIITVAGMIGVETASFIALFGALAFAVGMALQGNLGNFASGVLLLLFKPYKIGDAVEIKGKKGVVESIQMFSTILMTYDHRRIFIPNGVVTSGVIENITGQDISRIDMNIGIAYGQDIDEVKAIIMQVAAGCPDVLKEPATKIIVRELGDSAVILSVRPWSKGGDYLKVRWYMQENILRAFYKHNIEVPFPQLDVQLKPAIKDIAIGN